VKLLIVRGITLGLFARALLVAVAEVAMTFAMMSAIPSAGLFGLLLLLFTFLSYGVQGALVSHREHRGWWEFLSSGDRWLKLMLFMPIYPICLMVWAYANRQLLLVIIMIAIWA